MKGYILSVHRAKDEDTVVSILTQDQLLTLYRFYGARHSTINLGYKIDFEIGEGKSNISRLRSVLHEGFTWIGDINRMMVWQQLCRLLYEHLKENESVEPFYYELLEYATSVWHLQNPKRIAVEIYIKLLEHEGRLHLDDNCFLCERPLKEDPALVRSFLPTHERCSFSKPFSKDALTTLFYEDSSIKLSDKDVERLYDILCEGL